MSPEDVTMLMCLRRAFAMMALAMVSHYPRSPELWSLPPGFSYEEMDKVTSDRLHQEIIDGNVTVIVTNPQPFLFLHYKGTFGGLRTVYGVWLTRPASWRGTLKAISAAAKRPS